MILETETTDMMPTTTTDSQSSLEPSVDPNYYSKSTSTGQSFQHVCLHLYEETYRAVPRNIGDTYVMYPRPPPIFCASEALSFRYVRPSVRTFFLACLAQAFFDRLAVDLYFILKYVFVMTATSRNSVFDFLYRGFLQAFNGNHSCNAQILSLGHWQQKDGQTGLRQLYLMPGAPLWWREQGR